MAGSEEDEIKKFLAEKGPTKLPPRAARELGETPPGWRRNAERSHRERASKRQHRLYASAAASATRRRSDDRPRER
jgi:hypothetical protein